MKKGSGLEEDKLGRAVCDYLLSRLKPSNGEQPLPSWFSEGVVDNECGEIPKEVSGGSSPVVSTTSDASQAESIGIRVEQQAIVDKLSHDTWECLEIPAPEGLLDTNQWFISWTERKKEKMENGPLVVPFEEATEAIDIEGATKDLKEDTDKAPSEVVVDSAAADGSAPVIDVTIIAGIKEDKEVKQEKPKPKSNLGSKKVAPAPTDASKKPTKPTTKPSVVPKKAKSGRVAPS